MSVYIHLDLDDAAFQIRRSLDNATAYFEARKASTVNHITGLIEVAGAHALTDVILKQLDHKLVGDQDRFEELRREARALLDSFKKQFSFITRQDGSTVEIRAAVNPNGQVKHVGEDRLGVKPAIAHKGSYHPRMSKADRKALEAYLVNVGTCTQKELREIARERGIGYSTIQRIYYELLRP